MALNIGNITNDAMCKGVKSMAVPMSKIAGTELILLTVAPPDEFPDLTTCTIVNEQEELSLLNNRRIGCSQSSLHFNSCAVRKHV